MHVAVTAVGVDRPGIVAAVTEVLFEHDGNIEDSRMAILGGHFAMVLIVSVSEGTDLNAVEAALGEPARALDLVVSVRPVAEVPPEQAVGNRFVISVYGADRRGIVWRVSRALAERGVNISDLATHVVEGAPPVYVMIIEAVLPVDTDPAVLEGSLKSLAAELGIDVSMRPMEPETL